ncbi:MAG: hypothetical protein DRP56_10555 [Planctomycetota bacterium]|nr:MAG: hypothetical protein DRP56_10555 [Planctomycetota bacterium]
MIINDIDVAKTDAEVFSSAAFGAQVRCGGTNGIVAGTQFTASGVDFNASQVSAGCVIALSSADGTIDGTFEIVSVIDSSHLSVSQIRTDSGDAAIAVGSASGLTWSIKTLGPQIAAAELELSARLGLKPGKPDAAYALDEVQNTDSLKQIATAVLLVGVYTVLYTTSADETVRAGYEAKRVWYGQQAERLLAGVSVQLPAVP